MFCLNQKIITFVILSLLGGAILASTGHRFVYAQSSTSYNLTSSYIVQSGDTLAVVAARHGVSIQDIATTNSIRNVNNIRVGQVLIIPNPVTLVNANSWYSSNESVVSSQPASDQFSDSPMVIQTPLRIDTTQSSHQEGATSYSAESVTDGKDSLGYEYAAPATGCSTVPQEGEETHNVRPGDTLYAIARTYGVSVAAVRQRNGLATDRIRVNDCLIVPAGTTITPVPDRRRSSEQPPITYTPTISSAPNSIYMPISSITTDYTQS